MQWPAGVVACHADTLDVSDIECLAVLIADVSAALGPAPAATTPEPAVFINPLLRDDVEVGG